MAVEDVRGKVSRVQLAPRRVHTRAHRSSSVTVLSPQVPCNWAASLWMKKAPLWRSMPRFPRACLPPGSVFSQGQRARVTRPGPRPRTRRDGVSVLHLCCALWTDRWLQQEVPRSAGTRACTAGDTVHTRTPPSHLPCRPTGLHLQLQARGCH